MPYLAVRFAGAALGLLALIMFWQVLTAIADGGATVAQPVDVARAFCELASTGELWADGWASLQRVLIGLVIATAAGLALSFLAFGPPIVERAIQAPVGLLRHIPPIAWIPIAIGWFGLGFRSSVAIVVIAVFFPFTAAALDAMVRSRTSLDDVAALHRLRRHQVVRLAVPAAIPELSASLRLAVGFGWTAVIASELIGAQSGLGYVIQESRLTLDFATVEAAMVAIGLLGFVLSLGAAGFQRLLIWRFRPDLAAQGRSK